MFLLRRGSHDRTSRLKNLARTGLSARGCPTGETSLAKRENVHPGREGSTIPEREKAISRRRRKKESEIKELLDADDDRSLRKRGTGVKPSVVAEA